MLLHGGPGMGDYFDDFPEVLSPPYQVVSYNQRGCGPSFCGGSFDVDKQVADVDAIRQRLRANKIHIFGHSWGGLLGQLYAKAHPDRVASLVLCCSMSSTGRRVAALESKCIAERIIAKGKQRPLAWAFAGTLMQLQGKPGDLGFGLVMKQLLPYYLLRPDRARMRYNIHHASKAAWRGTNSSVKTLSDDYLDGMSVPAPVLILQGDHDVIRETNPLLAARFPEAANVPVEHASHFPWVEQPAAVAKVLLDFYSSVASATPARTS